MGSSESAWLKEIQTLKSVESPFERRIRFIAFLTKALSPHGVKPVVTGGHAVEFYTSGGYATGDIDLICGSREIVARYLELANFQKQGRFWHHLDLDLFVEIPGASLTRGEEEHLNIVEIDGNDTFFLGVEDILIDRLNAYVYWKSEEDGRWAKELLLVHHDSLDWEYLQKRAVEEKIEQALDKLKKELKIHEKA